MEGPLLWFANRGTGVVLLALLTVTTVLGVLSTRGNAGHRLPRFVTQALHRNLSLISLALLLVHAGTAVLDEYVDIRWWQALVPIGATYEPLWLALGTVALDLMLVVVLTSLVRHRLPHRTWRVIHLAAYGSWTLAVLHGIGIGTDAAAGWARWTTAGCVAAVATAATIRGVDVSVSARRRRTVDRASGVLLPQKEQAR